MLNVASATPTPKAVLHRVGLPVKGFGITSGNPMTKLL
jgi:hypothetical protein